jgi:hypothetical protein
VKAAGNPSFGDKPHHQTGQGRRRPAVLDVGMEPESAEQFYARVRAATGADDRLPIAVEDPTQCSCTGPPDPRMTEVLVWSNQRWQLHLDTRMKLPIALNLGPREHCDLATVPAHLAGEMGELIVAVSAAVESLPSVGRVQLAKYGDGGAHLHLFVFGRPARMLQLRGSPLLDWEENLPPVSLEVHRANAEHVARHLITAVGGSGPGWL